jgi:WD40 repeat protein
MDKTVRVWDAETGQAVGRPFEGHTNNFTSVAYSPNGKRLVLGSEDQTVRAWNAETGETVGGPFEGHTGLVTFVAYSPDGKRIVSGSKDQTVRVWNTETDEGVMQHRYHDHDVCDVTVLVSWYVLVVAFPFLIMISTRTGQHAHSI